MERDEMMELMDKVIAGLESERDTCNCIWADEYTDRAIASLYLAKADINIALSQRANEIANSGII